MKDRVHVCLKRSGGVAKAKGHDQVLEKAERSVESGLPLVALRDADVVVGGGEIQFGEKKFAFQRVKDGVEKRQGVRVLDRDGVQASIVDT